MTDNLKTWSNKMISAEEVKALMERNKPEYAGLCSAEYEEAAQDYGAAISTLQTLLNQAVEAMRSGIEYSKIREEYQEEHIFPDLAEQALAAIEPYIVKEGE